MVHAENDREHGDDKERSAAVAAANRASSVVQEVVDAEARRLVLDWKPRFDSIQKGWKDGGRAGGERRLPRGYPEPGWTELRQSADMAIERLGAVLRDLMDSNSR